VQWKGFSDAARSAGLVGDRNHAASIYSQNAVDIHRPPSEIRFILAQTVHSGASREQLENRFLPYLRNDNDNADDVHRKLDALIHGLQNPFEQSYPNIEMLQSFDWNFPCASLP
jgi:hypothetical protein